MLFLLNTVVVKTQLGLELPAGLESLVRLPPRGVLKAGCELYARHPRLEHEQPDIARWYCTLIRYKIPEAGGAHFHPSGSGYVSRLADIPLPELVRFWSLQESGVDIAADARAIWAAAASQAA
jgi:hypothetical protein